MKIRKLTGAVLALAMIAGMQGCSAIEKKPTEAVGETTAEETTAEESESATEQTTEETTEESEATTEETTEETTAETSESAAESEETTEVEATETSELPNIQGIVSADDCGLGSNIQLPVINIKGDEIDKLNEKIRADFDELIKDDMESIGDYTVRYYLYSGKEGIHSIIIDYSYCGWDGFYRGYTFTSEGHVMSNEEVIAMVGISKDDFYDKALEATSNYLNANFSCDGVPLVVDGKVNVENDYIGSEDNEMYKYVEEDLSKEDLKIDIPMVINDEGKLYICQAIMPIADYHDCEVFYSVPDGTSLRFGY